MPGETNLSTLIRSMQPILAENEYVFCTRNDSDRAKISIIPIFEFREVEGITCVMLRAEAESAKIPYIYPCRMITLNIHSSLEAIGFLAAITTELAAHRISVNPVSAYYHDHLFIPTDRAADAVKILINLAKL